MLTFRSTLIANLDTVRKDIAVENFMVHTVCFGDTSSFSDTAADLVAVSQGQSG